MSDAPPTLDVRRFLDNVVRSRLLDRDSLSDAIAGAPDEVREDAAGLANFLVKTGKLSRYQSRQLLKGVTRGFVIGKYQVLAPIGRGGMGAVFLARDGPNGPLVALKVLSPSKARRKRRSLVRFQREMVLSKHVCHPHLAWTLEAGKVQGYHFIAMEFIPGRSLLKVVTADGPLCVSRACRLMAEAALGLHHAHERGVIHRDLKPSNIMVTPHDHVKVLDLGLALVEGETVTDHRVVGGQGVVVGTMDFIAPEQTRNAAAVDRRADIYALGCTLYAALTGQAPFPGGDPRDKIRRHRTEEPRPLQDLRPDVPPSFADFVHRMMAKDPAERPATANEVAETLQAWVGAEEVLPLDEPEDADYRAAVVAAAASADQSAGGTLTIEDLGPAISDPDRPRREVLTFFVAVGLALAMLALIIVALALGSR